MATYPTINHANYKAIAAHVPNPFSQSILPGGPDFEGVEIRIQNLSAAGTPVYSFPVVQGASGEYALDLRQAFKVIALNDLADDMPDAFASYVDKALGKLLRVSYYALYTGGDVLEATWDFWVLNASRPIAIDSGSVLVPYDPHTRDWAALIPDPLYLDENDGDAEALATELTVFKGYPIDFAILIPTAAGGGTLEIDDGTATYSLSYTAASTDIVIRVPINTTTANNPNLNMDVGTKTWQVLFDGVAGGRFSTIKAEIVDKCGAVYLKWLNSLGTWSYWLFDNGYAITQSGKTVETYNEFIPVLAGAQARASVLAKESSYSLETVCYNVTEAKAMMIAELLHSPRVEMYKNDSLSRYIGTANWRTVDVPKFKQIPSATRTKRYEIRIEIDLPEPYLTTL